jgi:DNA-binding CsgD family transcriptional regulator
MRLQIHDYAPGGGFDIRDLMDEGLDDGHRRGLVEYRYKNGAEPFGTQTRVVATRRYVAGCDDVLTVRRSDVLEDRLWYRSSFFADMWRRARFDDCIQSVRIMAPKRADVIAISRASSEQRFTEEDRAIVRLLHVEVARQFSTPGEAPTVDSMAPLEGEWSPRERATLSVLLTGASEQQIAARLGISRHTVHDYIKAIHRKLGVTSRAELMARALARVAERA